jgi:hypothetical protein
MYSKHSQNLPSDIIMNVIPYLSKRDIMNFMRSSQTFRRLGAFTYLRHAPSLADSHDREQYEADTLIWLAFVLGDLSQRASMIHVLSLSEFIESKGRLVMAFFTILENTTNLREIRISISRLFHQVTRLSQALSRRNTIRVFVLCINSAVSDLQTWQLINCVTPGTLTDVSLVDYPKSIYAALRDLQAHSSSLRCLSLSSRTAGRPPSGLPLFENVLFLNLSAAEHVHMDLLVKSFPNVIKLDISYPVYLNFDLCAPSQAWQSIRYVQGCLRNLLPLPLPSSMEEIAVTLEAGDMHRLTTLAHFIVGCRPRAVRLRTKNVPWRSKPLAVADRSTIPALAVSALSIELAPSMLQSELLVWVVSVYRSSTLPVTKTLNRSASRNH